MERKRYEAEFRLCFHSLDLGRLDRAMVLDGSLDGPSNVDPNDFPMAILRLY